MSKKLVLSGVVMAVLLAGCDDPKAANKENFGKAIQEFIGTQPAYCVDLNQISMLKLPEGSPLISPDKVFFLKREGGDPSRTQQVAEVLVGEGLLSKETLQADRLDLSNQPKTENFDVYSLTEKGKPFVYLAPKGKTPKQLDKLCTGTFKLKEVTNFTEPSEAMGMKVSRASFSFELMDVASWAENPELKKLVKSFNRDPNGMVGRADLVLMNDGWKHSRLAK
ncbi:hypothetical protein A4G20_08965 [Pasteurellaceae bacterium RH1A]|nr:hypothetical protein A4G20_08965 [Pasteurellaceae bacterium RH1A]